MVIQQEKKEAEERDGSNVSIFVSSLMSDENVWD